MRWLRDREQLRHWLYFVFWGGMNTGFTYVLFLLLQLALPYQLAFAIAYAIGIVFSYYVNSRFVFRTPLSWKGLFTYPAVYIIQYASSALLLGLLVERAGIDATIAPLLVMVVTIPLTFVMSRWLLRRRTE